MATTITAAKREMPVLERVIFAAGDIFGGGGGALINVLYFFFLTDVVGLNPALAGVVLGTSKVWDAISKPIMGQITDNTRTRWGRRRPYLALGSVGIVAAVAWMWFPLSGMGQIPLASLCLAAVLFYITVATFVTVPYSSMSTETTTVDGERNQLNLMRLGFSTLASVLVFISATTLVSSYKRGELTALGLYIVLLGVFGTLFFVPTLLVGLFARERTPLPVTRTRFSGKAFFEPWCVTSFRSLLGLYLCQALMMDVVSMLLLAYTTYVATNVKAPIFLGIIVGVNLVAVVVATRLTRTVSKNKIYGTLLPLAVIAIVGIAFWPQGASALPVYGLVFLLGVGIAGSQLMSWVMFPDVVDAAELQLGKRIPGTISGLMSFVRALGSAAIYYLVGSGLALAGYQGKLDDQTATHQPDSAVWAIRLLMASAVIGFMTLGWWLARRYPLNRQATTLQQRELATVRCAHEQTAIDAAPQIPSCTSVLDHGSEQGETFA